jgi:lambda family phage tail tape measure protein
MAEDIASLGLRVDSQGVKEGADGLDRLAESAQAAEVATDNAQGAADALATATRTIGGASGEAATAIQRTSQAAREGSAGLSGLAGTAQQARAGVSSLDDQIAAIHARFDSATDVITDYGDATEGAAQASARSSGVLGLLGTRMGLLAAGAATAAGAIYVLVRAYAQGSAEAFGFNRALILSGNASGATADQVADAARNIDALAGTQRNAAGVLTELAASGEVAAEQLEGAALAAVKLERSAGVAASETVKNFVALGKAPADAVKKLNEQYHFLTASTYEHIRALEEQGSTAEAAAVAQRAFQTEIQSRADEVERHLGVLPKLARGAGSAFREMWDEFLNIGREKTPEQLLEDIERRLNGGFSGGFAVDGGAGLDLGPSGAEVKQLQREKAAIQQRIAGARLLALITAQNQQIEEKAIRDSDVRREADQRAREQAQRDAEQRRRSESSASIAAIKRTLSAETDAYSQQLDLLEARRAAGLVSETQYYTERRRLIAANSDAQRRALTDENARLEQESARVAAMAAQARAAAEALSGQGSPQFAKALDQANRRESEAQQTQLQNAERIKANKAEIMSLDNQRLSQLEVLSVQETAAWAATAKATDDARISLERYLDLQERQRQRELAGQGAGNQQREFDAGRSEIEDRFEQQRQQLDRDRRNNPTVDPAVFKEREQMLESALATELAAYERHWAALRAGEQSWRTGVSEALNNYLDEHADKSRQAADITTGALREGENAFVRFAQTGKLSFSSLVDFITAQTARLAFADLIGGAFGGGGGFGGFISGLFGGSRDSGGSGEAGKVYAIGKGAQPELFIPRTAGTFMPRQQVAAAIAGSSGGGSQVINVMLPRDASVTRRTGRQIGMDAARELRLASRLS